MPVVPLYGAGSCEAEFASSFVTQSIPTKFQFFVYYDLHPTPHLICSDTIISIGGVGGILSFRVKILRRSWGEGTKKKKSFISGTGCAFVSASFKTYKSDIDGAWVDEHNDMLISAYTGIPWWAYYVFWEGTGNIGNLSARPVVTRSIRVFFF